MIRKAAIAIALVLLTVSYRLSALGLGEIDMQSALNQPMKADITLTSASGIDIEGIKVMLGSREAHERLGLSRAKILSNFKFDIVKDGRGSPVINISSTDAVREPYLEFLLELVWDNGRIVREYTVLVDPPVTMPATPVAPVAPVVQAPAVVPPRVEPVAQPAPAPRPPATTFSPSPVEQRVADTYGPVRREEALWSISDRLRPDSDISIQQMMIALLRANPQAFPDNNINNMKVGSTLTIPDRDAILALTAGQARAEAGRQYNEWLEKRDVASAAAEDIAVVEESVADIPVEAAVVVAESDAQLKLTPPEGDPVAGSAISSGVGDSAGEAARDDNTRQQLALALEEVEASKAHSSELQSRVLELEATIERMDRLLKLKSDPLASLQNNAGNQAEEPLPDVEIAAEDEDVEIGEIEMSVGETEMLVGEAEELAAVTGEDEIVVDTEAGDVTEELDIAEEADAITADMEVIEDEIAPQAESPVIEANGIVKKLMDNPVLAGLGVLVAMLLGGFLWGSMRKHGDQDMFDDESESDERFTDVGENASGSAESVTSVSDPGTYDEGVDESMEVSSSDAANDPITEADVYLAYGRVHQAEDVLQEALREDPNNLAIRAKLLDVFHAAGNVAAFNNAAGEYRELAPEANDEWKRIAIMGYELAPGNELFSAAKQVSGEAGNSVDFDMDLSGMDDISPEAAMTDTADDLALSMDAETAEVDEMPEVLEFTLDDTPEDELDGEGLLASTDEVATKLDLARAYLDMEDPEGARSILQEVLEEGSTEQKSEAESLISKIV